MMYNIFSMIYFVQLIIIFIWGMYSSKIGDMYLSSLRNIYFHREIFIVSQKYLFSINEEFYLKN